MNRTCPAPAAQLRTAGSGAVQRREAAPASAPSHNETGLPDRLKAGVEALSGFSMDDVKVHYGSSKPAQLQAHAFTRGTEIHVAPGQERHLAHEAWHVVQQKQKRVRPTIQMKGTGLNDDPALEREADTMGARAGGWDGPMPAHAPAPGLAASSVVQRETKEQDLLLRARLAKDGITPQSITYADGAIAPTATVNGKQVYQWIKGHNHWRFKGKVKSTESSYGSFFGRLESGPLSMLATTAITLGPVLLADENEEWEADAAEAAISFAPSRSLGGSRATAASMGEFYFGRSAYLSADDYMLQDSGFEWLHMRADSLGGGVDPDNLYAGSSAANSHMAALEKAVGESSGKGVDIGVNVLPGVDKSHHSVDNGVAIVKRVNARRQDKKQKPFGEDELSHFLGKPSHKLAVLSYAILGNGKMVWKQTVDPLHPGKFDQQVFDVLKGLATQSIFGKKETGPFSVFNQAPSNPFSSSSNPFGSSSSSSSFTPFGNSGSLNLLGSTSTSSPMDESTPVTSSAMSISTKWDQ